MFSRLFALGVFALLIALGSPASSKEKKKAAKQARTWKTVVDYVFKNGDEDSIKAPASRTLGYDSDEVSAKSLGIDDDKSKDGRDHSIFVVYAKDTAGISIPKEIVLGVIRVKGTESKKEIDGYEIRMSLDGGPIRGMHAKGVVGHVVQQTLPPDSKELLSMFKKESALYLKEIELAQLTR